MIVKKGSLEKYVSGKNEGLNFEMGREDAIQTIVDNFNGNEVVVSTTGKCSRELFEYRVAKGVDPRDFYCVGSMGCASGIALGIADQTEKPVFVFDGDGAALMQLGTMGTIGHYKPENLNHIVFDNGSYDSTGGQPTISSSVDFKEIALACSYKNAEEVQTRQELVENIIKMRGEKGPSLLIVKVNKGARKDLGRPTTTPIENKEEFMRFLNEEEK
jgi:phosphonopyruvate decarboxylase